MTGVSCQRSSLPLASAGDAQFTMWRRASCSRRRCGCGVAATRSCSSMRSSSLRPPHPRRRASRVREQRRRRVCWPCSTSRRAGMRWSTSCGPPCRCAATILEAAAAAASCRRASATWSAASGPRSTPAPPTSSYMLLWRAARGGGVGDRRGGRPGAVLRGRRERPFAAGGAPPGARRRTRRGDDRACSARRRCGPQPCRHGQRRRGRGRRRHRGDGRRAAGGRGEGARDACSPTETTSAADAIAKNCQSLSDDLRRASLQLLHAMATAPWGAAELCASEGAELLLTAESVHAVPAEELR